MIAPSRRHIGFILLILVLFSHSIKFKDFCFDHTDFFIIGALAFLFIIIFLVVTFYNLYLVSIKKEFFDFFPLISLLIFGTIFYLATFYPALDFYKQKTQMFELEKFDYQKVTLKLYEDGTFAYQEKINDKQCINKGNYIKNKTKVILDFNNTDFKKIECYYSLEGSLIIKNDTLNRVEMLKK